MALMVAACVLAGACADDAVDRDPPDGQPGGGTASTTSPIIEESRVDAFLQELVALPISEAIVVRAHLHITDGMRRGCLGLLESSPPQCGVELPLTFPDVDVRGVDLQSGEMGERVVRWTDEEVAFSLDTGGDARSPFRVVAVEPEAPLGPPARRVEPEVQDDGRVVGRLSSFSDEARRAVHDGRASTLVDVAEAGGALFLTLLVDQEGLDPVVQDLADDLGVPIEVRFIGVAVDDGAGAP